MNISTNVVLQDRTDEIHQSRIDKWNEAIEKHIPSHTSSVSLQLHSNGDIKLFYWYESNPDWGGGDGWCEIDIDKDEAQLLIAGIMNTWNSFGTIWHEWPYMESPEEHHFDISFNRRR